MHDVVSTGDGNMVVVGRTVDEPDREGEAWGSLLRNSRSSNSGHGWNRRVGCLGQCKHKEGG